MTLLHNGLTYRLVDNGEDAAGNHRGVGLCEVYMDERGMTYLTRRLPLETFRDEFEQPTADNYRDAIIAQLEGILHLARSLPIIPAAEISA